MSSADKLRELGWTRTGIERAVRDLQAECEALGPDCSINLRSITRGLQLLLAQPCDAEAVAGKIVAVENDPTLGIPDGILAVVVCGEGRLKLLDMIPRNSHFVWASTIEELHELCDEAATIVDLPPVKGGETDDQQPH